MNQNLISRILTGLVAGSVAITALVISPYGVWIFCVLVSLLGMWELMRTCGVTSIGIRVLTMILGGIWWADLLMIDGLAGEYLLMNEVATGASLVFLPLLAIVALFSKETKEPVRQLGVPLLALVYVLLPFLLYFMMSVTNQVAFQLPFDWHIPFGIIFLVWTLDSMAYFAGRFLGKHLLFERISPKKTWEGSVGGSLSTVALGVGFQYWIPVENWNWVIVAAIIAVTAQLGDLVESMIKRSLQLKDSGNLLPGHGGILDRFDGFIFAIPFIFLYAMLF